MIAREELIQVLQEVGAQVLSVPLAAVSPTASLRDDLGMDSIDMFDVLAMIEQRYGLNVEREHFRNASTIEEVVEVLIKNYGEELSLHK